MRNVSGEGIITADHDGQRISIARAHLKDNQHFGFRHHWRDSEQREWTTDIVGWHSITNFLIGVHLSCQTVGAGVRVSDPKKPYIIRQILEELGGDVDGEFQVSDKPHLLTESEIDVAKRALTGEFRHDTVSLLLSSGRPIKNQAIQRKQIHQLSTFSGGRPLIHSENLDLYV